MESTALTPKSIILALLVLVMIFVSAPMYSEATQLRSLAREPPERPEPCCEDLHPSRRCCTTFTKSQAASPVLRGRYH